jgi:medium-chain acyl-[acyl-carrier-protein] hydrolase
MSVTNSSKCFLVARPKPRARTRLFCFPYAGGSASAYLSWEDLLPEHIELVAVQLPGRANRLDETLLTSISQMADHIVRAIPPLLNLPYLFYGHSLGSAVSFEVLHGLRARGLPLPKRFFCGARRAPHLAPRLAPIHEYPLEQFKRELKNLNGTPDVVLNNAEMMELLVPMLRADLKAAYTYHRKPEMKLDCNVSMFCGARDDKVFPEDMQDWQEHFFKQGDLRIFDGGHFFLDENRSSVVKEICESEA